MHTSAGSDEIRVLLVDDDAAFRELAQRSLCCEYERLEVLTANSPRDGLQKLQPSRFDCVVSDFSMPGMDGLTFLQQVREKAPRMPFILYTGKGSEELASDAIAAGVTEYVTKSRSDSYRTLADRIINAVEESDTDREHVEALRRSKRRFAAILEDPNMLVGLLAPTGAIIEANQTALEQIESDASAVIGEPFWETPWWPSTARSDVIEWVQRAVDGDYVEYEATHPRSEQVDIIVEGSFRPVTDTSGDVVSIVVSARDITGCKEREQELERQNERLDRFASIVSHDLQGPLSVAAGRFELLQDECDSDHLDDLECALTRMGSLIDELLTLAKDGRRSTTFDLFSLDVVASESWRAVNTAAATLSIEPPRDVMADGSQLRQLFENLFRNAIDHGGDDVTVVVGGLDDGFYVEDDGAGLRSYDDTRIFDLGYSDSENGSGIGLYVVSKVAAAHGWTIEVSEGTRGGARFEFTGIDPSR